MGKFNLVNEPWISVIVDYKGNTEDVSLKQLFLNADKYIDLAGDTKTQDFSVLRVLLAIIHTVFSRFDYKGDVYEYLDLDEMYRQKMPIDEQDQDEYIEDLKQTWKNIWLSKQFPDILIKYLEKWEDRFYLLDEKYPFFQVTKEIIYSNISKDKPSSLSAKQMNRLISESENKLALFSPKEGEEKEKVEYAEIARWLISFHGYTGLADKVIFGTEKYTSSKGWLFDIGGIYVKGKNLFETLMLNTILEHDKSNTVLQEPCWEYEPSENLRKYFGINDVNNISRLYTIWSRAIYINPNIDESDVFSCEIVKIPEIEHKNTFIEPMTIWKYNKDGKNKDSFTPRKHTPNKSLWRSFGLLAGMENDSSIQKSQIVKNLRKLKELIGNRNLEIVAISMQDDGNATSWVPVDEIIDSLMIDEFVLSDISEKGWVPRIINIIDKTQEIIELDYKRFIKDLSDIKNYTTSSFTIKKIEEMYFLIDQPFKKWISDLKVEDNKENKENEWLLNLKKIITFEAKTILSQATTRDYLGIEENDKTKNIVTIYNSLINSLNSKIKEKYDE